MGVEKGFENKIKKYLETKEAWFIKYWGGAKFTKEGIPDVLACYQGRFIGIEVKGPDGRPSLLQLVTLRNIRNAGGTGVLVYPKDWDGFRSYLARTNSGEKWYQQNIDFQNQWFDKLNR